MRGGWKPRRRQFNSKAWNDVDSWDEPAMTHDIGGAQRLSEWRLFSEFVMTLSWSIYSLPTPITRGSRAAGQRSEFLVAWRNAFSAIQPGELLVFRLKSPRNKIGGFGVFSNHSPLPIQIAWDSFGRANGVPSFEKLRNAIAEYRNDAVGPMTNIGCTILVEPVFLPPDLWFDLPSSWSQSIQRESATQPTTRKVLRSGISCTMSHNCVLRRFLVKWMRCRLGMALRH
jgi:hypothetical protein